MHEHLIVYNPEDIQLERIHEFTEPVSTWGNEIIAENTVDSEDDDFIDWIREWTYSTDIVAHFTDLERPDQRHMFKDVYPSSPIQSIVERENPGGDIRKYLTDIYGGVDESIKFDCGLSQNVRYTTGFEPMSIESIRELSNLGYLESSTSDGLYYPTAGEILEWVEESQHKFPQLEFGCIAQVHFKDGDVDAGCTGFVIYNADDSVMDWVEEKWVENEHTNMKYPPSELGLRESNEEYSPPDAPLIRMWWD